MVHLNYYFYLNIIDQIIPKNKDKYYENMNSKFYKRLKRILNQKGHSRDKISENNEDSSASMDEYSTIPLRDDSNLVAELDNNEYKNGIELSDLDIDLTIKV